MAKYSRLWDKWVDFSTFHKLETMPPDMRGLEIFIADSAKLSGSAGVANLSAAAVAHFSALEGFPSPFITPRFGKILRGVKNAFGKAARPKKPFTRDHIISFLQTARRGTIQDWRVALPMALCYQQLLCGARCFGLTGANVVRQPEYFLAEVASAKNNPDGFSFKVPVDAARPNYVGQFMADYVVKIGIVLGDSASFFACKVTKVKGFLKPNTAVKVANSTMRASCKRLIMAIGLVSTEYASHSCKCGAALAAMEAGLTDVQIQDLGRWARFSMVSR
jgi:hypothetical protein